MLLSSEELKGIRKTPKNRKGIRGAIPADNNLLAKRYAEIQGINIPEAKEAIKNLSSVIRLMLLEGFDVRLRTVGIFLQKFNVKGTLPPVKFKYSKQLLKDMRVSRPTSINFDFPEEPTKDPWNRY